MEVAVGVDVAEHRALSGCVLGAAEVALGDVVAGAGGVEARDGGLPADDLAHGAKGGRGGLGGLVVAKHGHAPGVLVEGADVGALRAAVHAAGAAFVDVAVLIDERVVADVAPAQVVGVVVPDAAHDARCLGLGVVVGTGRVVHGGGGGGLGVVRGAAAAGAPLRAGDYLGHAAGVGIGNRLDAALHGAGAAVQEHGFDVVGGGGGVGDGAAAFKQVHVAGGDLDALSAADVDRLGAELVGARLRVCRVHLEPLGPGAVGLLGAYVRGDVAFAGPGQAHDGELAVVGEFLDHAAHVIFFATLGADGGVVDGDVVAGRER